MRAVEIYLGYRNMPSKVIHLEGTTLIAVKNGEDLESIEIHLDGRTYQGYGYLHKLRLYVEERPEDVRL